MKIIFNSSMPRSGSTLLQNVLAQNPAVYASPTSGVLELLYGARANFTELAEFKAQDKELMKAGFQSFCAAGLHGWYSSITDKQLVIDKSRGWIGYYEWIQTFVDSPKMIVCVRDLRAVLGSMERLFRKNMHKADKADNPSNMEFVTVHQRITHWLNGQPVGLSLLRLYDAIKRGNLSKMHIVRYEDMLKSPELVMKGIYEYIGEPYFEHNFSDIPQATQEDDSYYDIYGDHKIRPTLSPSETSPIELFGQEACNNIINQNAWFFDYFYSPSSRFV